MIRQEQVHATREEFQKYREWCGIDAGGVRGERYC